MASFTDEISKFNPYVQQLPIDAMTQVGMYKQQQYDQGVQKIQGYIDNIAGMDVTDKHKPYLQSKLDELGGKLRTVAAGDFSNQQLVNSVGGMATQIVKDPIVQNAVYSTQVLRKGDADREAAIKAGKSNPNNDAFWDSQKAEWLNDGNIKSRFNSRYIEHWDVDKKLTDRAEKILSHPDVYSTENVYMRDPQGNTLYFGTETVKDPKTGKTVIDPKTKKAVTRQTVSTDPSQGKPEIDAAINKISIKGISAEKLYNNFLDSLDAKDAQQLRIDSWAKYRGVTMESFAPDIIKAYEGRKKLQSQEIVNLSSALSNPNLTSEQQNILRARLTDLQSNEKNGTLDKELNATLEGLKDPAKLESFKEHIYTQKHLMDMANDMSYKSYEQEYKNNPYMQVYMEKQRLNFDMQKAADESRHRWATYDLAKDKANWDKYTWSEEFRFKTDKEKKEWLEKHPDPVITTSTTPNTAVPKTVEDQWKIAGDAANKMKTIQNDYAETLFPGMTYDQKQKGFSDLLEKYHTNPTGNYSPDEKNFLKEYYDANNEMLNASKLGTAAEKLEKEAKTNAYKSLPPLAGYSGEDVGKLSEFINDYRFEGQAIPVAGPLLEKLKTYKNGQYASLAPLLQKWVNGFGYNGTPSAEDKKVNSTIENLNSNKTISKASDEAQKKIADFLAKNTPKKTAQYEALDVETNKDQQAAVNKYLTSVAINDANTGNKAGASEVLSWDTEKGAGKTKFSVKKNDDGTTEMVAVKGDGSKTITLPMNYDQQAYFPEVRAFSPYAQYKDYIERSPNRTTDMLDKRTPQVDPAHAVSAIITGFDVPGLKNDSIAPLVRFTIEGNKKNDGSANDRYLLNMFVKDPNSPIWKAQRITPDYVPFGGIENILNAVNKDAYNEALKTWK
jgi:hypothetical protein